MIIACDQSSAKVVSTNRPFTRFTAQAIQISENAFAKILDLDTDGFHRLHVEGSRNRYKPGWVFESGVKAAVVKWKETGEQKYHDLAVRGYTGSLRDYVNLSAEELRAGISEKGSIDVGNHRMRDACEHFAMHYYLTCATNSASKAAVILARFAEQIPKWPIYHPRWRNTNVNPRKVTRTTPQDGPDFYRGSDAPGVWGLWMPADMSLSLPLARAYDLIYDSGEMQKAGTLEAIEAMLRSHIDIQRRWGTNWYSNLDALQIGGILSFAEALGEPEWVHDCVAWVRNMYERCFYADGWWHEGTPSYHHQTHSWLKNVVERLLQGYSDPPGFKSELDGTRYDDLDMLALLNRQLDRADAALLNVRQPNEICQVIHDTAFPMQAPPMAEARSVLFGCMGHAILGTGKGKDNMIQASLHFGGAHGHAHYDCLNMILFAKGKELISETRYRPGEATNSTREWHTSTAGHVTVVVDEKDQIAWYHAVRRERQPEDAIPGVSDWNSRWSNHGSVMIDGKLRLFNTDFEQVQVAEADGERSYGTLIKMNLYRRTIALVKIREGDCYVVDIFRVKGGKTHDYMLHSCLDLAHSLAISSPLVDKRPGNLHKYLTDLHVGTTDQAWTATFSLDDGSASLKTFFLPQSGTELIQGTGPAMRRLGVAPFLAVRQADGESIFVVVHHPYVGKPLVQEVAPVPLISPCDGAVAIRVTLADRVDTIISTMDDKPWKLRETKDGKMRMRGRFAHIAEGRRMGNWAYLIGGDLLVGCDKAIRGNVSHSGVLTGTYRAEAGDGFDAFVTGSKLPLDGSLDGRTLMVDEAGLLVQSFRIRSIERRDDRTLIHSHDEPGMTIKPGLVKLEYYPCWGIRGQARFSIAGSALLCVTETGEWRLKASGEASAMVGESPVRRSTKEEHE